MQRKKYEKRTVPIVDLGSRGKDTYIPAICELLDRVEIVAVADIDPVKVEEVRKKHGMHCLMMTVSSLFLSFKLTDQR